MSGIGRSRRAWGWHPLVDEWAARIVAEAEPRPGELVVDIGAGQGAPTAHLVAAGALLQRAVVRRQVHRGHRRWEIRAGLSWPRRAFRPPPQVDSGVLVIRRPRCD